MAIPRGTRIGGYEVISILGSGGMGEVYRARDTRLGRDVAIKVLANRVVEDSILRARIEREARVLASVNHPAIATLFGVEDYEGSPAIVMELVEGEPLSVRLFDGPLPVTEVVSIARQVAEALTIFTARIEQVPTLIGHLLAHPEPRLLTKCRSSLVLQRSDARAHEAI